MAGTEEATGREAPLFRILVVEDNRDVANTLCLLLRLWGYDGRAVYDGQEALAAAHAYKPDCILMDIGLPGVDGYRLAEEVRRDEALRGTTLIAITAYSDEARAKRAGFDHHLTKPADPRNLEEMLRSLQNMGKRLERTEQLVRQQVEVVTEAKELMKEVKDGMQGVKQEIREVKEEVKEIKEELREVKENKNGS
jgi:CheY-like chemotaxis protein